MKLKKNDYQEFANLRDGLIQRTKELADNLQKVIELQSGNTDQINRFNSVLDGLKQSGFEVEELYIGMEGAVNE